VRQPEAVRSWIDTRPARPGATRPLSWSAPPRRIRCRDAASVTRWCTASVRSARTLGSASSSTRYTVVRAGETENSATPVAAAVTTRAGPNAALPAGRPETRIRAPAMPVPLLVAEKRRTAVRPCTMDDGPPAGASASEAGSATANCHMTGPATFPALSATVTAIVWTPAPRLPGA